MDMTFIPETGDNMCMDKSVSVRDSSWNGVS